MYGARFAFDCGTSFTLAVSHADIHEGSANRLNAKFSVSPRDQGEIVNKCERRIMDAIYEIADGTFDPQAGGKL